jgi:hypothetical protein
MSPAHDKAMTVSDQVLDCAFAATTSKVHENIMKNSSPHSKLSPVKSKKRLSFEFWQSVLTLRKCSP